MPESVLGDELSRKRQELFVIKFGLLLSQKEKLSAKDRKFLTSIMQQITAKRGAFMASDGQYKWLTDIQGRVTPTPPSQKEIDAILPDAKAIVRNGSLPSGKLLELVRIIDVLEAEDKLSRNDLNKMHYYVLEAKGYQD